MKKNKAKAAIKIHCHTYPNGLKTFYFTLDEKHCLRIEYDPQWDFGEGSPSKARLSEIEIHTNNAFLLQHMQEISLSEVPSCILDMLSYLDISVISK